MRCIRPTAVVGGVLAAIFLAACGVPPGAPTEAPPITSASAAESDSAGPKVLSGYFTEWSVYERNYRVADIPAEKLTHVNYAFAGVTETGIVILVDHYAALEKPATDSSWPAGSLPQLRELKRRSPRLRTLISIGGWTGSSNFSTIAADADLRARFCRSVREFVEIHGFDGADLDWEFPVIDGLTPGRPGDREAFSALARDLRSALGDSYLLTAAVNVTPAGIAAIDYREVSRHFDWFNLMAYDFAGAWDPANGRTGHHAPLNASTRLSVSSAIASLCDAGVPRGKIVVGVPLYGRSFSGVERPVPGTRYSGPGMGTHESGVIEFREITGVLSGGPGVSAWWDDTAHAPWLFVARDSCFVTYDDERSVRDKAEFIDREKLRGAMFWELSQDEGMLVRAVHERLAGSSNASNAR
jgi:chitinase